MAIAYGSVVGQNVVTINDPVYSKQLLGWMPEGLILPDMLPKLPSETYKIRIPKQNTPGMIHSDMTLSPDGFPIIKLDYSAKLQVTMVPRGLTINLGYADIEDLGGEAQAQAKTIATLAANTGITREYIFAANATSIVTQNQYMNVDKKYTDPEADILGDITDATAIVRTGTGSTTGCGFVPNVAIIPWPVFNVLRRHPQLVKAYFFGISGQAGKMSLDEGQMATLFGVEKVFIPKGLYYSNALGATSVRAEIWGNNIILARIDYSPSPVKASQTWAGSYIPGGGMGLPADFSYTWATPGILEQFGYNATSGYVAADTLIDSYSACLLPNVI